MQVFFPKVLQLKAQRREVGYSPKICELIRRCIMHEVPGGVGNGSRIGQRKFIKTQRAPTVIRGVSQAR